MSMNRGFKKPSALIPRQYAVAVSKLSKQMLADIAWSLAGGAAAESVDDPLQVFHRLAQEVEIIGAIRGDAIPKEFQG